MIPAGGSGKLTAKVKTSEFQHGSLSKSVTVHTDQLGVEDLRLFFKFEVEAPILVRPHPGLSLTGVEMQQIQAKVVLHRSDGKRLELSDPHSDLPMKLSLAIRPVTAAELGDARLGAQPGDLVLAATAPPQPAVEHQMGKVTVTTNDPDRPRLELPVSVWIRDAIIVRPAGLTLQLTPAGVRGQRSVVRLSSPVRRPFKVTTVGVSRPDLIAVEVDSEVPKLSHVLRVELAEGVDPSRVHEAVDITLKVSTTEPARPSLEIPVTIVPVPEVKAQVPASTRTPAP